ncbi:MAG: hydantoinase/oxoprolinase family protein [Oscillospiraceae bacterium]|nr:hydantoinase/oxoprolinase family protein [Oscillospiraceae bacterium]
MQIATDIGGTFTDLVVLDEQGNTRTFKGHTTPPNFEQGILDVLAQSGVNPEAISAFVHGTTTVINALTERKGAKTALITTKGFRDILEIARCNRPDLFNLVFAKPKPFVPRYLRLEVSERVTHDGSVLQSLDISDIEKAVEFLKKEQVESVAICFLNSYANDINETAAAKIVTELWPEVFVSTSAQVTREWREYERSSTAVLNAYVGPVSLKYLDNLDAKLTQTGVSSKRYIMQSNGGTTTFNAVKTAPINLVESGPVGGIFGAAVLGQVLGEKNLIAFDVGGTTAKCSLIDSGEVKITTSYRIEQTDRYAGYPIMVPVLDIVEIGNGGGSIAWVDQTQSLKVGPKSAGSLPGPVAYGKGGTHPTTTDACLITGRLSASNFDTPVDISAVESALVEHIGKPLDMDAKEAAVSILRVAEANLFNALRLISVRRGYDPRDFALTAFGGGGPMHAAPLARALGIKKVIIPVAAAVFSAWGMLMTDIRHDYIQTNIGTLDSSSISLWDEQWGKLKQQALAQFADISGELATFAHYLDMRYLGQEHTVKVPVPAPGWDEDTVQNIIDRFHQMHEQSYTFRLDGTPVEIVNLHLTVIGHREKPKLSPIAAQSEPVEASLKDRRMIYFDPEGWVETPVYNRQTLLSGTRLDGPAVIEEKASAALVCPGQSLHVDTYGNLIIETRR